MFRAFATYQTIHQIVRLKISDNFGFGEKIGPEGGGEFFRRGQKGAHSSETENESK